jgi:peptidoglycan/xylan/chitin deacetylase (PgdA/CDA1 family)
VSRIVLTVPPRASGWRSERTLPLLIPPEAEAYSALVAAGFVVDVVPDDILDPERIGAPYLILGVDLETERIGRLLARLPGPGLRIVSLESAEHRPGRGRSRRRRLTFEEESRSWTLSRQGLHARLRGARARFSSAPGITWQAEPTARSVARWGRGGRTAISREVAGAGELWRVGFSLDRLTPAPLSDLMQTIAGDSRRRLEASLPEGCRAVVVLLHDVEEPLPDDPRGMASVREGTVGSLEAEASFGFRATYNVVGEFCPRIADLVRRMAAERHEVASHGLTHRVVADLQEEAIRSEVRGAAARVRETVGLGISGFRSPRSRWNEKLLRVLSEEGYRWNAEADDTPYPYPVPAGKPGLIRLPVAADDWAFVKENASPRAVMKLWQREVRSAMKRGAWIGLGSHPSVLGSRLGAVAMFHDFLGWLALQRVKVLTASDAAIWWADRIRGRAAGAALAGHGIGRGSP